MQWRGAGGRARSSVRCQDIGETIGLRFRVPRDNAIDRSWNHCDCDLHRGSDVQEEGIGSNNVADSIALGSTNQPLQQFGLLYGEKTPETMFQIPGLTRFNFREAVLLAQRQASAS